MELKQKKVKTESGHWIPATYKTNVYPLVVRFLFSQYVCILWKLFGEFFFYCKEFLVFFKSPSGRLWHITNCAYVILYDVWCLYTQITPDI